MQTRKSKGLFGKGLINHNSVNFKHPKQNWPSYGRVYPVWKYSCKSRFTIQHLLAKRKVCSSSPTSDLTTRLNPFPDDKILDWSKLKQTADDNLKLLSLDSFFLEESKICRLGKGKITKSVSTGLIEYFFSLSMINGPLLH